jgi:hypothetical protein
MGGSWDQGSIDFHFDRLEEEYGIVDLGRFAGTVFLQPNTISIYLRHPDRWTPEMKGSVRAWGHEGRRIVIALNQGTYADSGQYRHAPGIRWQWERPDGSLSPGSLQPR